MKALPAFAMIMIISMLMPALGEAHLKVITGGTVVDPGGTGIIEKSVVLVEGDKILRIGRSGEVDIPREAERLEADGKWIIPGLIDGHVHFFQSGGLYTRPDIIDLRAHRAYEEEISWVKDHLKDTFKRYLMSGVTSTADLGGPFWNFEVRERARATPEAPRVAVAGPLISTYMPRELVIADPPIIKASSPEDGRDLVRKQARCNPDFIKIWFIVSSGEDPRKHLPLISEVVKESHKHGIRVVAHATELETARVAVEAGADILAHSIRDREVNKSFIDLLLSKGIIYIPTLMVGMRYEEVMSQQIELSAPERKIANPRILESLNDLQNIPERLIPPGVLGKMKRKASVSPDPIAMKNLEILKRAGVTIALGTDAGNIGTVHGPAVFREMELMEEGGMSAEEILTSATMNGAKLLGKEKELGTLETGKLADLVILSSNPLAAPGNMSDIHLVMKGGRIIGP